MNKLKFDNFNIVTKIIHMYLLLQTSEHVKEYPDDDITYFIYKKNVTVTEFTIRVIVNNVIVMFII